MLHLQEMAKHGQQEQTVQISERLPYFITAPCTLSVTYDVAAKDNFYLVSMHTKGTLQIQCQRCLEEFSFSYDNNTTVAVCRDDQRAEQLLEQYECIVSANFQVSLEELVIDELHLYAPEFHPEITDCSSEIDHYLGENIETN